MTKAFVIGLPVREAYTGTTIELCHVLEYDDAYAHESTEDGDGHVVTRERPTVAWKKYTYSEEEAAEDEGRAAATESTVQERRAVINLLDAGPLDQEEHEALFAARDRLCSFFPGTVMMRLV